MIVNFTIPPDRYTSMWMGQTLDAIKRGFISAISKSEAAPRLLLRSPNGTIYALTVENDGSLTTTLEPGKDRTI